MMAEIMQIYGFALEAAMAAFESLRNSAPEPMFLVGVYAIGLYGTLVLHQLRAQLSLGPLLAWSGLLTFLIWQLSQIGWWVDWRGLKFNAGLLALVPAVLSGMVAVYASDGVRAARAYLLVLVCAAALGISYAFFLGGLSQVTSIPSFFVMPLYSHFCMGVSLLIAAVLTAIGFDLAQKLHRYLAMPFGFILGFAAFLPLYSLMAYGWPSAQINILAEAKEYFYVAIPAGIVLGFYGIRAARRDEMMPARPLAGILHYKKEASVADQSILDAREQIAELKQLNQALRREEDLRHMQMQHSPLAMIEVDRNNRIVRFNDAAAALAGRPLVAGMALGEAFGPLDGFLSDPVLHAKRFGKYLCEIPSDEGAMRSIEFTVVCFGDRMNQNYSILAEDVSAREQDQRRKMLSERVRGIHKTGRVIHHDFSNLLLAIQSHLNILGKKLADHQDPELQFTIEAISNASVRGKDMLQQFGAGQVLQHPELRPQDLRRLIEEAARILSPQARQQNIRIELDLHDNLLVEVDSSQILRVLLNLITNSIRAMPRGGHIVIRSKAEGQGVSLLIQDSGIGMSEEQLAQVFDPGFSTKGQGQGGLGLAISYLITEAHGGKLGLESKPGKGTLATLWLPLLSNKEAVANDVVPRGLTSSLGGESVLLLLRDDGMRQKIAEQLQSAGCEVAELQDHEELQAVLSESPSLWTVLIRGKEYNLPPQLWHQCRYLCDVVLDPSGMDPPRIKPSSRSKMTVQDLQNLLQAA